MKELFQINRFLRRLRGHMKSGELARTPLRLLRLELRDGTAECEWMARPPDPWDEDLRPSLRARNFSEQALLDAFAVRELLFRSLPGVERASIAVYREEAGNLRDLIITGTMERNQQLAAGVRSLAMRAILSGLCFCLQDGALQGLQPQMQPP